MWFSKKKSSKSEVVKRKVIGQKKGNSVEYFEAKLQKKPKAAKKGLRILIVVEGEK